MDLIAHELIILTIETAFKENNLDNESEGNNTYLPTDLLVNFILYVW